ncbi:TIGAR bisphosphatase, partial [Centropus bengalensis]|nr:TIGAR bisphosphatase [Centropus bengalensis]
SIIFCLFIISFSGETRYNKDKILQGQGVDEPLSATGFRQADAAGSFLSNVKFTHVFSSDLLRAKQASTAATILGKNKFCKDLEIKYDARLRERKYGVAEGRPLTDLKAMAKAAGEQCPSFTPSGGETLDEVKERGRDFFEFLCQLAVELEKEEQDSAASRNSGAPEEQFVFPWTNQCCEAELGPGNTGACTVLNANILVVSHGAYMRNWIGYFVSDLDCTLPTDLTKSQLSSVSPNTGVSHFVVKLENGDLLKPEITCVCLNQDSHL